MDDDTIYQLVTVKRNRGGVTEREQLKGIKVKTKTQFEIRSGDFLISKRQIVHGACGIVPQNLNEAIVSNEYSILRPKGLLEENYMRYLPYTLHFQKTCFHASIGVHVEKMVFKINEWFKFQIDIPPKKEQKIISDCFSQVERTINLTKELLAEKQLRRKGLMQQLLSGKRRLQGFDGAWRKVRLGETFDNRRESNRHDLPLVAITTSKGVILRNEMKRKDSSNKDKSKYLRICPDDIGYNTMRMWQGVSGLSELEGIISPAYTVVTPRSGIDGKFMALLFKFPSVVHKFYRHSQGLVSDTWNLKFRHFSEIEVRIPEEKEQQVIAQVFSVFDREIDLLKDKLVALREQKKGLMQQLLTGKIRTKPTTSNKSTGE